MLLQRQIKSLPVAFRGLVNLVFPPLCAACRQLAPGSGSCFCYACRLDLRPADLHLARENEVTERLWGLLPVEAGAAMYFFEKRSPIQKALHRLKYQNSPEIGTKIGRDFGRLLAASEHFAGAQVIVPVPIHPKKERKRGYNQSQKFAEGLSEKMGIPVLTDVLVRRVASESQTKKTRSERFENVNESFFIKKPRLLQGKNVLLVDDVLTTGATLESCGRLILEVPGTKIFVATIAVARR